MTASNKISRRTVLATGGLTAAGAVLAGCSAASSSKNAADPVATPASSASSPAEVANTATGQATSSAAATSEAATSEASSSAAASSAAAPSGAAVAKLADIPVGGSISASLGGKPIVLSQPTAGSVVGFSAICPHQGCTVAPASKAFDCPCHGSQFDAATGAVLRGPAMADLSKLTVAVSGGSVLASTQG